MPTSRAWRRWSGCLLLALSGLHAIALPEADPQRPPTNDWIEAALAPDPVPWPEIAAAASDAAVLASQRNRTEAMAGWLHVARWARLLGSDQRHVTQRWVAAMNSAQLGHANLPRSYDVPAAPLSARLTRSFAVRLLSDDAFSESFFDLLSPYDYLPEVLDCLQRLAEADGKVFESYRELAVAIALVFDVPPPPTWPHGQVSATILPRQRPDPVEAFAFWVESDKRRRTLHRLNQLSAAELKFVVDAAAPFAELVWAQQQSGLGFDALPGTYNAVTYRTERIDQQRHQWPGSDYALPTILATGGICVDQAYFASEMGKAKGVPTLLFRGAGLDGRHAWFGYLDARQRWQLDVGRYAEQKLVAGVAYDPQTWADVNDHELRFLAEGFRRLPSYRQSRAWQVLAQEHLRRGELVAANAAATRSTNLEPRNVAAWSVLAVVERAAEVSAVKREATLRKAARALSRYPDLYVRFMREVIVVMRERGQSSAADHEARMLAQKFRGGREDLAVSQAAEMLNRSMQDDPPATQLRVFESALRQFGVNGGMEAFDRLVRPFFRHAMAEGREQDAAKVLAITARMLPIERGSQFAQEMTALAVELR